ncbi:MAG: polysaccharide deacetylase family protein [bacterium]|nr:polysaccharide deacetylase family protein [bacterium]
MKKNSILTFLLLLLFWVAIGTSKVDSKILFVRQAASAQKLEREHKVDYRYYSSQSIYTNLLLREFPYDMVSDLAIPQNFSTYTLIILPDIVCLNRSDYERIEKFVVQDGGGLLVTGATAICDGKGNFQGYDFLRRLLGASPQVVRAEHEEIAALHLRYGYAGSMAAPPGYFLKLYPVAKPLYLPKEHSADVVGYWSEVFIGNKDPRLLSRTVGFVVKEFPKGGRVAWIGADLEDLQNTNETRFYVAAIFRQLFQWLMGDPIVALEPWPNQKQYAVLFHGDIETDFDEVVNILEPIKKYQAKTTFNLLMNQAEEYPEVVEQVRRTKGELSIHGYEHDHFWGQPLDVQKERLERAVASSKRFQFRPLGLRPPYLSHDENTIEAIRQMKMLYITADRKSYSNYPRVVYSQHDTAKTNGVVLFPKGELDDYDFFDVLELKGSDAVSQVILLDYQRLKDVRGLYQFNYHSQYLKRKELIVGVDRLLKEVTTDKTAWLATSAEIADWILQREGLNVEYQYDQGMLKVTVTNQGLDLLAFPYLRIVSPKGGKLKWVQLNENVDNSAVLNTGYLKIPKLKKGETFSIAMKVQ